MEYVAVKAGRGTKVHAALVVGEVTERNRQYGQKLGKLYRGLCTLTNTHNVNQTVRGALLPQGTPITCVNCLRKIQQQEEAERTRATTEATKER